MSEATPSPPDAAPAPAPLDDDALSGRKFVRWNLGALLIGLLACAGGVLLLRARPAHAGDEGPSDPSGLLLQARWSDGLAEVARYAAFRTIYGRERGYELVRVAVKEPFDPAARLKPDTARAGVVDAIKTVAAHRIGVPPKPYEYRLSLIVRVPRREPARLLDATMSAQEWCGNTFVLVRGALPARPWLRESHGYFDAEGPADQTDTLPADTILEDQLPLLVRTLDLSAGPREVTLLPSLLGNKTRTSAPYRARISRIEAGARVTVPAGTFTVDEVAVVPLEGEGTPERPLLSYTVGTSGARPLVRYADRTGRGQLTRLERIAYWREEGR